MGQASGTASPWSRSMLWVCPQGWRPRQDVCGRRIRRKKGLERGSAQTYCLFPCKRAGREWSRDDRDQEANALRLFPTGHLVGLEGGGGRLSSSLPQAGGRAVQGVSVGGEGSWGDAPQRKTGLVSRVTLSLLRVKGVLEGGPGASDLEPPVEGKGCLGNLSMCASPAPRHPASAPRGPELAVPRSHRPHMLTECATGACATQPAPPHCRPRSADSRVTGRLGTRMWLGAGPGPGDLMQRESF